MKPKHEQMYMRIAEAVAETSSAQRLKVGAVAVKDNMVIGSGYNGLPSGLDGNCEDKVYCREELPHIFDGSQEVSDSTLEWVYDKYPLEDQLGDYRLLTKPEVRHAEANLLLNIAKSTESSNGAIVFCTHSCCKFCAMDLVDARISKFYYRHEYRSREGIDYLNSNGVKVEQI